MAEQGVRFTRFYSAAPVCSPTRGSCLTGRHPFRYGIYSANTGHLPQEEITVPELLRPLGYHCGHFGKWHLGTLTKTIKDANREAPEESSTSQLHRCTDSMRALLPSRKYHVRSNEVSLGCESKWLGRINLRHAKHVLRDTILEPSA